MSSTPKEYRVLHKTDDGTVWALNGPEALDEDEAIGMANHLQLVGASHGKPIVGIWIQERLVIDGAPMRWALYGSDS